MARRTHQWIDDRSLALARAAAQKVRHNPALFAVALGNLERWKSSLLPWPQSMQEWEQVMAKGLEAALSVLTEEGARGQRLRQSSPFVGVLTMAERDAIFRDYESRSA